MASSSFLPIVCEDEGSLTESERDSGDEVVGESAGWRLQRFPLGAILLGLSMAALWNIQRGVSPDLSQAPAAAKTAATEAWREMASDSHSGEQTHNLYDHESCPSLTWEQQRLYLVNEAMPPASPEYQDASEANDGTDYSHGVLRAGRPSAPQPMMDIEAPTATMTTTPPPGTPPCPPRRPMPPPRKGY